MDLLPNEQQDELVAWSTALVGEVAPLTRSRERIDSASRIEREDWRKAVVAGLFAARPFADHILLAGVLGRELAPLPYLATLLASSVGRRTDGSDLAERLAIGDTLIAFAERDGEHIRLYEAESADLLLMVDEQGVRLFEASCAKERHTLVPLDPLTGIARARLGDARPIVEVSDKDMLIRARLLVAAQATAIAEVTRDLSMKQAQTRVQFGKPIGTFQAVKHRCADMAIRAESALALTRLASAMLSDAQPGTALQAYSAKAIATRAALTNARDNIQNFGGYGTLDMLDHHLLMKRCHVLDVLFGNYHSQLEALIEQPLIWDAA